MGKKKWRRGKGEGERRGKTGQRRKERRKKGEVRKEGRKK